MNKKKEKYLLYLTILSYSLYYLQGGIYERGSVVPRISLLIILAVDFVYWAKSIKCNKTLITSSISIFFLLLFFSWLLSPKIVSSVEGSVIITVGELKNAIIFLFSYFPFRYWVDHGVLNTKNARKISLLFFGVYIVGFFIKLYESLDYDFLLGENVTNNGGYMIAFIFPLTAFFFREKKIWFFIAISVILVLMSAKRGAILCVALEVFLFMLFKLKTKKLSYSIFYFVPFLVLAYVAYRYIGENEYLFERLNSGDSGGRDVLYDNAWKSFLQGDLLQQIFGYGFLQTIKKIGQFAHSDWYEIIVDHGITGIMMYLFVFYSLFRTYIRKVKKAADVYRIMFCSASCCWLVTSLFSMGYLAPEAAMLMIAIAISEKGIKDDCLVE